METRKRVALAAIFFLVVSFTRAEAQLSYSVTDLGTFGGNTSTASGIGGQGTNPAGMIVGSSTTNDNSEHAFLYVNDQMFDLNTLCDLSQSDFKVLTVAKAMNDSCVIIGEGITNTGDKHAFLLKPVPVDGGNGRTLVVSGFGFSKGAAGGGKRIVVVTGGMVLLAGTLHVRCGHLPVGGSRFLAIRPATVRLLLLTVGAVSTDRSSRPPRRIAGKGVVNATVLEKKRSGIVPE